MKKATLSKNKRSRIRSKQNLELDLEAVKVLRTVKEQEAFYFYEAIGKPTGEVAQNLTDFLDKVKSVKPESLMFHLQRKDFQHWIEKILGDSKLAEKLEGISPSSTDDIRMRIYKTVENRIKQLQESSAATMVEENATVLLLSS
jgi:hypothetical protein